MTDIPVEEAPPKKSKLPLILGFVLALVGGGGGFFAVSSGILGGAPSQTELESSEEEMVEELPEIAFVALDPIVISLRANSTSSHLRFSAQLEVSPDHTEDVEALKPRIVDVLNGYLRAVDVSELSDPWRVRDLLIMEFVLN